MGWEYKCPGCGNVPSKTFGLCHRVCSRCHLSYSNEDGRLAAKRSTLKGRVELLEEKLEKMQAELERQGWRD